jgi:archaellum component FlaC
VDLFGRMEYFFKRLEAYIEVRPTEVMTDIIVKIMVEVLSILGIVTKEIGQGRMSMSSFVTICERSDLRAEKYLKKLIGRKDIEDALHRLDQLTQEEARMAAIEALKITRGIDHKVEGVDERVQNVDTKVEVVDNKMRAVDCRVQGVDDKVQGVDRKVKGIDIKVQGVDERVKDVDGRVGSVIQCEMFFP